ncbi:6-phospho-beta-glucosidase [Streptomyces sp. B6B3]|uniref:family 4 glycosyl hydrolase n=1 Tax=Streptomyces sp. B6B3 TaxID=3153570 RepID=UPI00325DEA8D
MRLTIIGGGGFRVPLVYRALHAAGGVWSTATVTLHDADPARARVIGSVLAGLAAAGDAGDGPWPEVRQADDLDEALRGADFVFCAIRVGGVAGRVRDERVPLAAGVLGQETTGAGGVLYGLRTVPVALRIAERVRAVAPGAWVVNFSNPAGMVTEAMSSVLGHRVIGICDSPLGLVRRASRAAGVDPARVRFSYLGLNHLGWLTSLTHEGRDLLPELLADDAALASFEEGRLFGGEWLRVLGALPNEYLHHYYFRRESLRAATEATQTRGELLAAQQSAFYEAAAAAPERAPALWENARLAREESYLAEGRAASGGWQRDAADLEGGGYEGVALAVMRAIAEDTHTRLILNVRNGGAVPELPPSAVIETVCETSAEGAHPVPCTTPGLAELGLMLQVKASERATIEAAATGSATAALRALALHPLVDSPSTAAQILHAAHQPA